MRRVVANAKVICLVILLNLERMVGLYLLRLLIFRN